MDFNTFITLLEQKSLSVEYKINLLSKLNLDTINYKDLTTSYLKSLEGFKFSVENNFVDFEFYNVIYSVLNTLLNFKNKCI